jgi:endonuclease YncB( thermonuclease family)
MVAFDFPRTTRPAQPRQLARTSDGDTPVIDQPVRMVSVDTPEKQHYAGLPPTAQTTLNRCRRRLQDGTYDGRLSRGPWDLRWGPPRSV